ncbi:3-oxoacyl-[acyl-carrier-protein] synthase, mitochondrial-like [Littorina saxatilis]|uniref:3-oxoacyl-[acyl-carrier-protein] synthase n=1 Tax=Littorina saxatilis TaxID=31220 RepID=A0AAN9FWP6_9CAEN
MAHFHLGIQCCRYVSTNRRRVVVTGVGLVTCLGVGAETVWNRLLQGQCGIGKVKGKGYEQVPCQVAGLVPCGEESDTFNRQRYVPKSQDRGISLASAFALAAAEEALTCAGWKPQDESELERTGVCVGTGMVSLEEIADAGQQLRSGMYRKVSPWFVPEILINIAAGHVSLKYGFKGPNHSVSTACATGLHAIGDASRFIRHGDADVMVAGGAEACVGPLALAGFARMRALCTSFNDSPQEASRPFDKRREGFVMAEGAGLVVLEELSHAQNRGATIYGEVLGYGLSGDANHLTAPSESGDGAFRCMKSALKDAGIAANAVGHVNAHATSTPLGDAAESHAIQLLLGEKVLVTSTKGALGHLLGAAGSVEAIIALKSCQTGVIPPTLNLSHPDTGCDLDYVTGSPRPWAVKDGGQRIALSNSFGFGGTNACVCLAEFVS